MQLKSWAALRVGLGAVGALAGLIASLGAGILGIIARQAFQTTLAHSGWMLILASLGGAALTIAIGSIAIRRLLATSSLLALSAAA